MNSRNWRVLWTKMGIGLPAGIKENKDGTYVMLSRNREELIDALPGGFWIFKARVDPEETPASYSYR